MGERKSSGGLRKGKESLPHKGVATFKTSRWGIREGRKKSGMGRKNSRSHIVTTSLAHMGGGGPFRVREKIVS